MKVNISMREGTDNDFLQFTFVVADQRSVSTVLRWLSLFVFGLLDDATWDILSVDSSGYARLCRCLIGGLGIPGIGVVSGFRSAV